jgi:hypothetical protein
MLDSSFSVIKHMFSQFLVSRSDRLMFSFSLHFSEMVYLYFYMFGTTFALSFISYVCRKILNIEFCYTRYFVSIMPLFSLLQLELKVCSFVSVMPFF